MMTHQRRRAQPPSLPPSPDADTLNTWSTPHGQGVLAGCPTCASLSHHRLDYTDRAVRRGRCGHHYVVSVS
ncbi:hypothetical protein IN07_24185 [Modestobacter caceresii]|jgi:hypothetical protein|uniref:Uncharacterized protein n=1 Tax=Modestobacter caceresii TaxID=1522368 RepID=A0A098Y1N6_9ACTN|nr:hypothetical protein IN07_24185 [Modestobacter caceresii]